jgi:hypothetical protein
MTQDMGRVFPAQWEHFRDGVPQQRRDGNLAAAYGDLLCNPDPAVHEPAAQAWCRWEDTHVRTRPDDPPDPRYEDRSSGCASPDSSRTTFVTRPGWAPASYSTAPTGWKAFPA